MMPAFLPGHLLRFVLIARVFWVVARVRSFNLDWYDLSTLKTHSVWQHKQKLSELLSRSQL